MPDGHPVAVSTFMSVLAQTAPAEPGTDNARIIAGIVSLVLGTS